MTRNWSLIPGQGVEICITLHTYKIILFNFNSAVNESIESDHVKTRPEVIGMAKIQQCDWNA